MIHLLNPGEQLSDILKISPKQLLLIWFNYHLKAAGYEKKITNFSGDAKDSENNTKIIIKLYYISYENIFFEELVIFIHILELSLVFADDFFFYPNKKDS